MRHIAAILTAFLCFLTISAQEAADSADVLRPITSGFAIEAGSAHRCDTYLTPLHYSGWGAAISYEWLRATAFDPENFIHAAEGRVWLERTLNPARTASLWGFGFNPAYSMMRRWRPTPGLTLAAGPRIEAEIGALYMARNSNNPASVIASATLGAEGMATYEVRPFGIPTLLRYQPSLPLIGAFFSPDYDELYYEIWLGNHSGLCHAAWPGSYFRLDQTISADIRLKSTILRLGYRCGIASAKASGIVTRHITHSFVIGISTEWISLRPGSQHTDVQRIISALYQ